MYQPAVVSQRFDVSRQVGPANHIKDQVRTAFALQDFNEVFGPVVDGAFCAKFLTGTTFLVGTGRRKHARTKGLCYLDRGRANAG